MRFTRSYPLQALLQLRTEQVDQRAHELAERRKQSQQAAKQAEQARDDERRHAQLRSGTEGHECERLENGEARAEDLQRWARWDQAQADKAEALQRESELAGQACHEAAAREDASRQALADSRAQSRVVERHRTAYLNDERKRCEERQEEDALDAFHSRHTQGRS